MSKQTIMLGKKLFEFSSKADWISKAQGIWKLHGARKAQGIWKLHGARSDNTICVDQLGRICTYGLHFAEAERDKAYPIEVYMVRPESATDCKGGAA
jgi:hypothetical protein